MATVTQTRPPQHTTDRPTLFLAFALRPSTWKLGFTTGSAQRPRERSVPARNVTAVQTEIARAKQRFGLPEDARGRSCYEAGRDGCWLHRGLVAQRVENIVVDSSSSDVQRRKRRAKTDRLDVHTLLTMLLRHHAGEQKVWSVVQVPSVADEDRRQRHRELLTRKRDRTRLRNRLKGFLASQGLVVPWEGDFQTHLAQQRLWDGSSIPVGLRQRLMRAWEQWASVSQRIAQVEADRREMIRAAEETARQQVPQLLTLTGIGTNRAWLFVMEWFGWRPFRHGKEVGALSGLTPTPYARGNMAYELGIAKAGKRHGRALAIEIAWGWLRFQPQRALTQWYPTRFGHGGSRLRRIGSVALARTLCMALWRFVETGVLPEGAALKAVVRI